MIEEHQLKELLAPLLMVPADGIVRETSLAGLNNSLGEVRLRLALKRFGIELPGRLRPLTFGALDQLLRGAMPAASAPAQEMLIAHPVPAADGAGHLRIGLDVQDIDTLPLCHDYWEDEFYRSVFGNSEIAYAVLQPEPRIHFAGFWCAKEALRKCDASFRNIAPQDTVIAHDETGRPYLLWKCPRGEVRLGHAISISHASNLAMAVVAAAPPAGMPPEPSESTIPLAQNTTHAASSDKRRRLNALMVSLFLALAASISYILLRFFR